MARLSSPIENLKSHYAVVIIGSGYGGSIAASRLARAGQQVCVLERGKEFQSGEFPDTLPEAGAETQVDTPQGHIGPHTGLYDFRVNEDINIFIGCGLGGTSLVNANVSLRAEPRVFEDPRWPRALRNDLNTSLAQGYTRAEEMLKPTAYPNHFPALPKTRALEKSAAHLGEKHYSLPINVTFQDGLNHVGVHQQACKLCGDCVTGCNHAAKNTLQMNYLPDATNHGAEIFTQVSVRTIERRENRWLVHYHPLNTGREKFNASTMFVAADTLILAAGTLGSTEILLRSRAAGLSMSRQLGRNFSGNGDVLGFGYNNDQEIRGIGFGHRQVEEMKPVGPCITSVIDMREREQLQDGLIIEEGSIPGAISSIFASAVTVAAKLVGKDTGTGLADYVNDKRRELETLTRGAYHGAVNNTQTYLVMAHDDGAGQLSLDSDRLRVRWPGVGEQPLFTHIDTVLERATQGVGGTHVKNPTWSPLFKNNLVTVHPLGGCCMGEDAERGVVNHQGQVFSGDQGQAVYDNLYVCDGSIIPCPLGVNPLLTISALAERSCALLARDRGWRIDYSLPSKPPESALVTKLGLQFTETMRGYFSTQVKDDYEKAATRGRGDDSPCEFTLTVTSDNLDQLLRDDRHQARLSGTVTAKALSDAPMTVSEGIFHLFVRDPSRVNTRNMVYLMKLTAEDGRQYYFEGLKVIHDDPGLNMWADTTTLFITIYDAPNKQGPVLGKGILKILPADFRTQMTTLKVTHAKDQADRLKALADFGNFFAGTLHEIYGGILAKSSPFNPSAPPRKKRPLRMDAPETFLFKTGDDVELRLIRYRGGSKGPVIVAPGFGTSSLAFLIDTVETNLPEYLYAHGFDVWLFDYRASPDLVSARTQFTIDDIAVKDYPAAVEKIRSVTKAESVQVMAHCVGSMSFLMSMLSGLQGVRSAVCSQLTTHPVAPTLNDIKAGLHLPCALTTLSVEDLSTDYDPSKLIDHLSDKVLRLYPTRERCTSPTCRRILFMYGEVYSHDQLDDLTHNAIHEMFGVANMTTFLHIARILRTGHIVDSQGNDIYLPHLDRLAIPLSFIHGAKNGLFLPRGSEITYNLLREKNGADLYSRHVIPEYAHMDCFIGRNAAVDVFPIVLEELEKHN